jgi:nitroimidazol reductase NimA-like FMN-containing flavoprotein (pyridoxamine 5'-phosphate oxidase superfamily)
MHETPDDLAAMQAVLDRSYAAAGAHLLGIHEPERRLDAQGIADRLQDMVLLTLATVTRDGRPLTGPVDGFLYRGLFHFGSSPESMRFRHIRERPQVSVTHLPGEHLAVTVHGRAERIDVRDEEHAGFLRTLRDFYGPRVGDAWEEMLQRGAAYARIEPERMFAFHMDDAG